MALQHQVLVAQRHDPGGPLTADAELTPLQTDADGNLRVVGAGEVVEGQETAPVQDVRTRRLLDTLAWHLEAIRDALWEGFGRLQAREVALALPPSKTPVSVTLTLDTDAEIIGAPMVNESIHVRRITASNTSATLTRLDLKEGSGGTVRYSMGLAASGGGVREQFEPFWKLPPGVALYGDLSVAVTDVRVNVDHYVA